MVYTTINNMTIKGPYQEVKKGKDERAASGQRQQQQQQQQSQNKNDKYGSWGSVYKNKQHFVDMHIC